MGSNRTARAPAGKGNRREQQVETGGAGDWPINGYGALVDDELAASALRVALEALGAPTFLLDAQGVVLQCNRAGDLLLRTDPKTTCRRLQDRVAGGNPADGLQLLEVSIPARPSHWLAIQQLADESASARLALATRRWELTPRQVQVLQHIVEGLSNKAIAERMCCARNTVELHITALFQKMGVQSRAEATAVFWMKLG